MWWFLKLVQINHQQIIKLLKNKSSHPNFYQQKETKINCIYYITDYIKLVIENGNEFLQEHLYKIIDTFIYEELSNEVIETLNIVMVQFEFDKEKLKDWIESQAFDQKKTKKLNKILNEFVEQDTVI